MKKEDFEKLLAVARKEFAGKKKAPTTPEKQFEKGALWLWNLLMSEHDAIYYEEQLRADLIDREGEVKPWKESLVSELAEKKARLSHWVHVIEKEGELLEKRDKNGWPYKESNPLIVHTKELERTIGMWREHLGLSNKSNPERMRDSARKNEMDNNDPMGRLYEQAQAALEES